MKLDIIGDIHGHCDTLERLLARLGYSAQSGVWKHAERKVLFLGDYIDRGPKVRETLHLVRGMVGEAKSVCPWGMTLPALRCDRCVNEQ